MSGNDEKTQEGKGADVCLSIVATNTDTDTPVCPGQLLAGKCVRLAKLVCRHSAGTT